MFKGIFDKGKDKKKKDKNNTPTKSLRPKPRQIPKPVTLNTRSPHLHPRLHPSANSEDTPYAFHYASQTHQTSDQLPSSSLIYSPYFEPANLPVTRGDYSRVRAYEPQVGQICEITGPTACGKTTYALLELLQDGTSCWLLQPCGTNVANALVEFNHRIQNQILSSSSQVHCPRAGYCTFLEFIDPDCQLVLGTVSNFVKFVCTYGCFPPVDVVFLDEYHLPNPDMVIARAILTHCLSAEGNHPRIYFASATPLNAPVPPPRLDGITVVECEIADVFVNPLPEVYTRKWLGSYCHNLLLVIMDSCAAAHHLARELNKLGESCALLCSCVNPEQAATWIRMYSCDFTFIATPETEAGLTISCSHFLTACTAVRSVFLAGILAEAVVALGERQRNQRLGRAGRTCHTLAFVPPKTLAEGVDFASPVVLGSAYLRVLALTGVAPDSPWFSVALEAFPRLEEATHSMAVSAVRSLNPVLTLYRIARNGKNFKEFGGTEDGFISECGKTLKLFKWPEGRAFAPFLDLTQQHDLTSGQTKESLESIAEAAIANRPHLLRQLDATRALDYAEKDPVPFAVALWSAFRTLEGPTNLSGPLEKARARCTPAYMFGSVGARAWGILENLGARIVVEGKISGGALEPIHRILSFRGERMNYTSDQVLGTNLMVSETLVTALLLPRLRPLCITYVLQDDPSLCTDLSSYKHLKNRSNNDWFNQLRL